VIILIEEPESCHKGMARDRGLLREQCRQRLAEELQGDGSAESNQRWSQLDRLLSVSSLDRCTRPDNETLLDRVKPLLADCRRRREARRQLWTLETLSHLVDGYCNSFSKGTYEGFEPAWTLRERYWPGQLRAERHLLSEWIQLRNLGQSLEGGVALLLGKAFCDDAAAMCHGRWS
jgi:hypothetical protein